MFTSTVSWPRYVAKTSDPETKSPLLHGKARRVLASIALAAALSITGTATANADIRYVGGGTWDFGITSITPSYNWSNYYHRTLRHGSSVTGDEGLKSSPCVSRGKWSHVRAWDSAPWRIDQAYWRHC